MAPGAVHRGLILEKLGRHDEAQLAYRLCRQADRP
jgi:hypothetical protein